MANNTIIRHENDEWEIRFDRRRYGRTTFVWAEVRMGDWWVSLGDPWQKVTPSRKELIEAVITVLEKESKGDGFMTRSAV